MTDVTEWIQHRMRVLEIAGPTALAEQADLAEQTVVGVLQFDQYASLQQSQRRRLAWALQVNLKKLNALADGHVGWIGDADRYLPFSVDLVRDETPHLIDAAPALRGDRLFEPPQGTPVLGRVGPDGRIVPDECWDEQWGQRLPDGCPERRDTYALQAEGAFLIVRNANPWEARAGTMVAVYLFDDADGAASFGLLLRCTPGTWALRPGLPGGAGNGNVMTIEPERVQRIGRLIRTWTLIPSSEP